MNDAGANGRCFRLYWDCFGFEEGPGGIMRHCQDLRESLAGEGVFPELLKAGRGIQRLPAGKILWPLWSSRKVEKKQPGKNSLIFHGLANINLPVLGKNPGIRFVLTIHDLIPLLPQSGVSFSYREQFRFALPRVLKKADRVVCVSPWTRDTIAERFPDVRPRLTVIHNGRGQIPEFPETDSPENTCQDQEIKRLLYVARHEPYKRLNLMIQVLNALPSRFHLTQVTDRNGQDMFKGEAKNLLRSGRLRVLTGISDLQLAREYARSDLYLHPSLYEGFGLPAWEALGRGVPVLFQKGSALDILDSVEGNLGLPSGSQTGDWVDAIRTLCKPSDHREFTARARRFVASRPSWQDAAASLKSVYNELVGPG